MKLTDEHKKILAAWGFRFPYEIAQIEHALSERITNYTILSNNRYQRERIISREEALQLLGTTTFLSGIARSTFHFTSARQTKNGELTILFDSSQLFR